MEYRIRRYRDPDAEQLSQISLAAIRAIGSRAYSPEQIGAWAGRHGGPEIYRDRVRQGHVIFVAVDERDRSVAYALIEPDGHLDRLYNHPDHSRRGLAARLLAEAENHALEAGVKRLYTEASELARPAFERAGYQVLHRRDFAIEHDGHAVPIHNYAMEKRLF
ncbi:GNAT family N-acetyltransferase [Erythrobacter sp.]|jgi:putative acetyltransferase|uniref:GNAT family N-acetyltransferase n=1 Tax=Erythrobacter sp. TaxID=1042 RepID=UPI002EBF818E|nr:GNAT family N-acetyltransferase [Erythrobacter sp.]